MIIGPMLLFSISISIVSVYISLLIECIVMHTESILMFSISYRDTSNKHQLLFGHILMYSVQLFLLYRPHCYACYWAYINYFVFLLLLNTDRLFNKLQTTSEVARDKWKWLKLFIGFVTRLSEYLINVLKTLLSIFML